MGFSDKVTAFLTVLASLFAAGHIVLSAYSVSSINWMHFVINGSQLNIRQWKTRTRGLTLECIDGEMDSCQALERHESKSKYSSRVHSLLDLRSVAFSLPLVSISLTGLVFLLGAIIFIVLRKKPRRRQVLLLIMGVFNWISALISFIGLITYLESQNQDAYKYDPNLITARAAWNEATRLSTEEHFGHAFSASIASCVLCHVATFTLFAASLWT